AEYDLFDAGSRRISLVGGDDIGVQGAPKLRQTAEQAEHDVTRPGHGPLRAATKRGFVRDGTGDLLDERFVRRIHVLADAVTKVVAVERALAVKAHVDQGLQMIERLNHRALVRQRGALEVVDLERSFVARHDPVDRALELPDAFGCARHARSYSTGTAFRPCL